MRTEIRERLWDCPQCGQKRILGRYQSCPACGKQRGDSVRFYSQGEAGRVPPEAARTVSRQPDWYCAHCNQLNPDSAETCRACGAPKTDTTYFDMVGFEEAEQQERQYRNESVNKPNQTLSGAIRKMTRYNDTVKGFAAIGILALFMAISLFFLVQAWNASSNLEATVTNLYWKTSINVEHFVTNRYSDWSLPPGARLLGTEQRIVGYHDGAVIGYNIEYRTETEQVWVGTEEYLVGTRDLGNGYEEAIYDTRNVYDTVTRQVPYQVPIYEQVPDYRTWYEYELDEWAHARYATNTGTKPEDPVYPDVAFADNEREKSRSVTYMADYDIRKKDEVIQASGTLSQDKYEALDVNETVTVDYHFGSVILKPDSQ